MTAERPEPWRRRAGIALDLVEKHLPAALLLAMVSVFLLQIVCRYFFSALRSRSRPTPLTT